MPPPIKKVRTKKFSRKFQFLLWDYPSIAADGAVINDSAYDLFDNQHVSFIARVDMANARSKPNRDVNWPDLPSYSGVDIWKKGNAYNCGYRLADLTEFYGHTQDFYLWKHNNKSYAGGIFLQNWGASTYPTSAGRYFGKAIFHSEAQDKLVYQGKSLNVGYSKAATQSIYTDALNAANNDAMLSLQDFIRHTFATMKIECDRRNLSYPAYLAWDWESQIGPQAGTSNESLVQDVRSTDIPFDNVNTGVGLAGGSATANCFTSTSYVVYCGGNFTSINGVNANNIAKFEAPTSAQPARWFNLGSGTNGTVRGMATFGNNLYVCGDFTVAGSINANSVARFNTATNVWEPLTSGISKQNGRATVNCVVVYNNRVYFAGDFDRAGGVSVNNIACYNPSNNTWTGLGINNNGTNGIIHAMCVYRKRAYLNGGIIEVPYLVVGGSFTQAGGTANTQAIAAYGTDNTWRSLGAGVNGVVYALCEMERDFYLTLGSELHIPRRLIVGGEFTTAGGISAQRIAAWTPTTTLDNTINIGTWSTLGAGFNATVRTVLNPNYSLDLFVGGDFTKSGNIDANRIARWDVSKNDWFALNNGFDGTVNCMISHTINGQYIGGSFIKNNQNNTNLNGICKFNDYTRHYDTADILINNLAQETPNRYETEVVYEEYDTSTQKWMPKTLKDAFTEAGFPAHRNSIPWQRSNIRDSKSIWQSDNRDFLRKMTPYYMKINDFALHKILFSIAKEYFPAIRCGNYSHEFPLNGDIENFMPADPRNTFVRLPHENANIEQYKPHLRADYQQPVCYSQNINSYLISKNSTRQQIQSNGGVPLNLTQDVPHQLYYNNHPFGSTNQEIYVNYNKQKVKALTATAEEKNRFTNLSCIPYGECPRNDTSSGEFASYNPNEIDILDIWKYYYDRGVRTMCIFNTTMCWYGSKNAVINGSTFYGNNLTYSQLFHATVSDFIKWIEQKENKSKGRISNE